MVSHQYSALNYPKITLYTSYSKGEYSLRNMIIHPDAY